MAGSGFRRDRLTYQIPVMTADAAGQQAISWLDVVSLACVITPGQREVIDDGGVAVRTDYRLETSWHPAVSAGGRFRSADGREFNVSSVIDPDGSRRRRLIVTASEIAHA